MIIYICQLKKVIEEAALLLIDKTILAGQGSEISNHFLKELIVLKNIFVSK
jgi:hypothetical protein